jgi:hypothetical protein
MVGKKDANGWTTIDLDALDDYVPADDEIDEGAGDDEDLDDGENDDGVDIVDSDDEDEGSGKRKAAAEEPKKSRAQERIRQLVAKEKAARDALAAKEAELAELREAANAQRKESATTQQTLIKNQMDAVKDALRRAHEEDDHDKVVDLQEKLNTLQIDKRIVDAQAAKPAVTKPAAKAAATADTEELDNLPEEMQYWVKANKWAVNPQTQEDRVKVRAVRRISRELSEEGFVESEGDFYDELDARLEKAFASEGGNGVQYSNKDTRSSSSDVNKRKSPVSTTSRTPASRRTRIALSPEEREMAERLGLDPKQYALRKKAREDSTDTWTTIL